MIKKPDKEKPGVFSFMYPLSNQVWLCVMVAFVAVSLVLFFVGRWSPYEWTELDPKGGSPINNFNLLNTFWFSLGALMQQGSDTFPRLVRVLYVLGTITYCENSNGQHSSVHDLYGLASPIKLIGNFSCFASNITFNLIHLTTYYNLRVYFFRQNFFDLN